VSRAELIGSYEKLCKTCNTIKLFDNFHARKSSKDGKSNKCKVCKSEDDCKPHNKARRDRYDKSEKGLAAHNKAKRKWRDKNIIKNSALIAVKKAVDSGDIIKSKFCESCETIGRVEGHHHDYAKPLEVEWLCSQCHRDWHCEHGEALNANKLVERC